MNKSNHPTFDREILKQRIVGACVLIILLALLWPLLFNFDEMLDMELELKTPLPPKVKKIDIVEAKPPRDTSSEKQKTQDLGEASKKTVTVIDVAEPSPKQVQEKPAVQNNNTEQTKAIESTATPRLDEHGIPITYVVQLGSFNQWSNASKLRDDLIASGHKAYITPVTASDPAPYQVFAGPFISYKAAQEADQKIKQHYKLNDTLIRRFSAPSL